jgi:hypothetical protein
MCSSNVTRWQLPRLPLKFADRSKRLSQFTLNIRLKLSAI